MLSSVLQFGDSRCGKPAKRRQRRGLRLGLDSSLAFLARERFSKVRGATRLGYHPRADGPRGIVAQVLAVAALEIGDPIAEIGGILRSCARVGVELAFRSAPLRAAIVCLIGRPREDLGAGRRFSWNSICR